MMYLTLPASIFFLTRERGREGREEGKKIERMTNKKKKEKENRPNQWTSLTKGRPENESSQTGYFTYTNHDLIQWDIIKKIW